MKKALYHFLTFLFLMFCLNAEAATEVKVTIKISTFSDGTEIDPKELLTEGWRLEDSPESGPNDFSEEELEEIASESDNVWTKTETVILEKLRTPKILSVGDASFSIYSTGLVSLDFSNGDSDNVAHGEMILPKDADGNFLALKNLTLKAGGHDNSSWGFDGEAQITVSKKED